ncbi:MAG: RagB/SusD family nutrient uptake outer membrane protein [Butyricimonas faecalis]
MQGLKARVLAYAKQMDKAAEAALVVIGAQENKDIFPWVKKNDINPSDVTLKDRTFSTEHLFALNTIKLDENIKGYFKETMSPMLPRQAITSGSDYLYDVADYRLKWFDNENGLINVFSKFWQSDKKTVDGIVLPKRDRMPMIRISEMYYIVAESMKISDPQGALDKLNLVRKMRGLTELLADLNPDAIQQEIQKEYEREFLGEGQLFFFHKRQGTRNIATANAVYKLPMPDLEIDLGERE